jgi:hypothetical protein
VTLPSAAFAALILLFLAPAPLPAQSQDPVSLADVARQKPARRAELVVTDDDLPPGDPVPAESASDSAPPTPAPDPDSAEAKAASITVKGLLENASLQRAREVLAGLENDRERLLARYAELQKKLGGSPPDSLRRLYLDSLSHRDEVLASKQQQIDSVRKAIAAAAEPKP